MRVLLVLVTALQLTALGLPQALHRPYDGKPRDGDNTLPEGHWCQNHAPEKPNPRAHECHCDYICVGEDSEWWPYYPTADCLVFCKKAGVQCSCHPEEPCPHPPKQDKTVDPKGLSEVEWLRQMGVKHDELKHGGNTWHLY